jgi:uncharacterized membrane protein
MAGVSPDTGFNYGEFAVAMAMLVGLMAVGYVVMALIRRKLRLQQQAALEQPFTLDQLREWYKQGQLTQDEYERAKAKMAQRLGLGEEAAKGENPASSQPDTENENGTSSS